jgi:hypothetical protein
MSNGPDTLQITQLKKALNEQLIADDFNLLSPEVLTLSQKLDDLMLPIFKSQLAFYNCLQHYRHTTF